MTAKRVLADTSVWIEWLRKSDHPVNVKMEFLIENDGLCVASAIKAELMRGAESDHERSDLDAYWRNLPLLKADDAVWEEAGRLAYRLRRKGITPGLIDCYLASLAIRHGSSLMTLDKGFQSMPLHCSLKLETLIFES